MIIFADEKLNVKKLLHEAVHQGSNKANSIQFVAPINSNATIKIAFELPNAENTRQYLMESVGAYEDYYMWSLEVPYNVSKVPGRVRCQIIATIGSQQIGSQSVDFVVTEGVEYNNAEFEEDQFSEIIGYINETKVGVANKVNINYNEMVLVESPLTTYSSECYRAIYSYNAVVGNIANTTGYFVYQYNADTGTGEYVEATGAVDNTETYYTRVISGYERVTLPDDYEEGVKFYQIKTQQSIFNDENGLYFYIVQDGKSKIMRIQSDKITIDDYKVITEKDMTAENVAFNDEDTTLGVKNVQDAIKMVDKKVDAIDTSQVMTFVKLGMLSIAPSEWSSVQYLFVNVEVNETNFGNTYFVFNSETKDYEEIILSADNYNLDTAYYKRDEFHYYDFKHRLLTNSVTQDILLTPDDDTNALCDEEHIKIYPHVEMGGTTGNAYGRIKVSKLPSRTITFTDVTLYGTGIASEIEGLKASQIDFKPTDDIESISVQGAVVEVNTKINNHIESTEETIREMENTVANLRESKTVDAYIVPNSNRYSSLWLKDKDGKIFNTADGSLNQYDNYYIVEEGTDYSGNTYTWSGTNYVKVAGNLSLGSGATQAYPGNEGAKNRTDLTQAKADITKLAQRMTSAEYTNNSQEASIGGLSGSLSTMQSAVSALSALMGNATLTTSDKTIKGAINEILKKSLIPTFEQLNNRASGKNSNMYHYFTVITWGDYRIIFGKVDSLDANGNVKVSWDRAMFKSSTFHSNDGYVIVPGFTIQTRGDNRGMDEPTHVKDISTDGFTFYNSNGFTTTGTYVAFGKKI